MGRWPSTGPLEAILSIAPSPTVVCRAIPSRRGGVSSQMSVPIPVKMRVTSRTANQDRIVAVRRIMSFHQHIARTLRSIGYKIDGAEPSTALVKQLFALGASSRRPKSSTTLSERLCEEHLAVALTTARQVVQERQLFWGAGERLAALTLTLDADRGTRDVLALEADAISDRRDATAAAKAGEVATLAKAVAYATSTQELLDDVKPDSPYVVGDVERQGWLAYVSRSATNGFADLKSYWGTAVYTDKPPTG